jgi:hypothetical protein
MSIVGYTGHSYSDITGPTGCSGPIGSPGIIGTPEEIAMVNNILNEYDYKGKLKPKVICTEKHLLNKGGNEKPKKHWLERFHIWRVSKSENRSRI